MSLLQKAGNVPRKVGKQKASMLPPGQNKIEEMPRFGQLKFADRFPSQTENSEVLVFGDVQTQVKFTDELRSLPRTQLKSDFHCVTTWSCLDQFWEGVLFNEIFEKLIVPLANPSPLAMFAVLYGQDGCRACLPLSDLLANNVILADTLNGKPLSEKNGAPLRIVAPDHYGYKSIKYLYQIELIRDADSYHPSGPKFMEHPRARVALEERGRGLPGWIFRYLYRPLVISTKRKFERSSRLYRSNDEELG